MAVILSLETSTSSCSTAIHKEGKLVSARAVHEPFSAASRIAVMLREVMDEAGFGAEAIEAVAVSQGPGSYTGLRIGTATAKGFCYSRHIPFIAVNSLVLLAEQVRSQCGEDEILCPMIDARRMEVYTMLLDKELNELEAISARIIDEISYSEWLVSKRVIFFGTGSDKCRDVIRHEHAVFMPGVVPLASEMGRLAEARYQLGAFEDISSFEPLYLKDFLIRKPKSAV